MLTMQTDEPRIQITRYALQDIAAWLGGEMPRYAREHLVTALVKMLGAVLLVAIIYALLLFLFATYMFSGPDIYIALRFPVLPLAIGFFSQLAAHSTAHGVFVLAGEGVTHAGSRVSQSDDNLDWFVQAVRWSRIPAWLFFSSFESLFKSWQLGRAKPDLCAEILANMAAIDRRATIPEIEDRFRDENLVTTVRGLLAFPGVLVSDREYPCVLLSKELGDTVRQML